MTHTLLTGNGAAAWGARLARAEYIPAFPITPQTEIIESISSWVDSGAMQARMVTLESEHSMLTAAGAAAVTGVRVFSATSSQGLLYGMEMVFSLPGWRAPFVLVNVSRGLSTPITLEPDHNDILAARDSGCLQVHCATCQEVLDSVLMAYRLAEDPGTRLPVIVNMDGFHLSFTREPVEIPDPADVDRFLPAFNAGALGFRADKPLSAAVAVLGGSPYSYFRYQTHLAVLHAADIYEAISGEFLTLFGRDYPAVESYRAGDAEMVFVMLGSFATKARAAVDQLRAAGHRIGLIRPRLLRPFPARLLRQLLEGKQAAMVVDQNLSMGMGGILHAELAAALYGHAGPPPILASFVGGLGGREITPEEFYRMVEETADSVQRNLVPPPRLLYTDSEMREVRKLQAIAQLAHPTSSVSP